MTEEINVGSQLNHQTTINGYQIMEQDNVANGQVEQISKFLSECPEAALNVHKYLQKKYSNQQQKFNQPVNSTPKRGHPLDDSGGSTNNGSSHRKFQRKGINSNDQRNTDNGQQINTYQQPQPLMSQLALKEGQQQQKITEDSSKKKQVPFEQLKHAVSSNLPCFLVEFNSDANHNNIPSALHASDFIFKELKSNGISIDRFSLVGWAGKRLKLGVNNKVDYATLMETDKWSTEINGINIVVVKPKYTPDSFALVVRYIPRDLEDNFVANEIKRTIASADRIKRIHYAYQRKTDDYRFDVKNYSEYNAALQLGRIAIGHSWLSCWCIGHLRAKCDSTSKCRVCLENLNVNITHICKNEFKCAQCDGNHHSLDNQCQIIHEYKHRLKEDVEVAIKKGLIHRSEPIEKCTSFELREQDFPALINSNKQVNYKWGTQQLRITSDSNSLNVLDSEKTMGTINDKLTTLIDSNKRIEKKVDQQTIDINMVALDTQLHQAVLVDTIEIMKDFLQNFIPALLTSGKAERLTLMPLTQRFFNRFHDSASRLNEGFQLNRQISLTQAATNRIADLATTAESLSRITQPSNSRSSQNNK
ncbi:unnamed protein product [Rotaria sp. Silwood2]|nr:unnamed protein product [Rotaria sp. Silwood2]CAF4100129.1 unnamed protein product [Rotaria sp. Silwood2]CAF4268693.1 unnamed protein product [Rotaria sp. Silwood2]CAF4295159.1 unnamed protein product [Rotaria sp. Silwood2]CAF4470395.1 unnamed protein product [Rotaria sp. Silwood2]